MSPAFAIFRLLSLESSLRRTRQDAAAAQGVSMGNKVKDSFVLSCPTVPVVRGSEVRFSITEPRRVVQLAGWPLSYVSCGEITPPQTLRTQWGAATSGARYDSFSGFRLGSDENNLTLGARSTYASSDGRLSPVEQQRVGVASVTLGGRVRFKYWNDHSFWWWPMGDGGDQGDTAGLQFGYNLASHSLNIGNWRFDEINLSLRLGTGIPDRTSGVPMGDGTVYSRVNFSEINRGDIDLSTTLSNQQAQRLEVGILVNSDGVRHAVQDRAIHHNLGIPEFPQTGRFDVQLYLRLTEW
jgi:hypothetical protein